MSSKKAIFLDRDGTICEESNYLSNPDDLEIFPYAAEAIRLLNDAGFLVVIITNQSGIGRGYFNEDDLDRISQKMFDQLDSGGARIDAIYYCPHAPEDNCDCRKPKTKMIENACKDFPIDLANSWIIGDKAIDIQTGINAGTKSALVLTGYGKSEIDKCNDTANLTAEDLLDAALKITAK